MVTTATRVRQAVGALASTGFSILQSSVKVRGAQASRRHRIGRAHARHVMATVQPINTTTGSGSQALLWVGPDDRGVELEIVAVVLPELYLVIHAMPTALRREPP